MSITGEMLVGEVPIRGTERPARAIEAATGKPIDPALPVGTPMPRSDLRRRHVAAAGIGRRRK